MAPADNLRKRKTAADGNIPSKRVPAKTPEEYDNSKEKRHAHGVDLEPNIWVVAWLALSFISFIVAIFYYKIDNRNHGPVAAYINQNYPFVDRALNNYALGKKPAPLFGAAAHEHDGSEHDHSHDNFADATPMDIPGMADGVSDLLSLTEAELKAYTGEDKSKPIYLAINGTIFDVSSSPAFYGPGGHYNHFTGKDATRAWVTECWDTDDQFTWRLEDVHLMFMPKYLDEMLTAVAEGDFSGDLGAMGAMPQEMMTTLASKAIDRFGKVRPKTIQKRREEDRKEADKKVLETLDHWYNFFWNNDKYKVVGKVIRDEEGTPKTPPKPCDEAMKKRPLKGGKLESMMGSVGSLFQGGGPAIDLSAMGGGAAAGKGGDAKTGEMPAAVREQIEKAKKEAQDKGGQAADAAADAAESVKEKVKEGVKGAADKVQEGAEKVKQKAEDVKDEL
ncbi:hypothetical protein CBER1_10228 [Cercospora berteroae]|uniref:Cytochrome b5 heme-binding domain-containing protein n=1 Tax=Cercospora berteroae TaxID=357750 RepID=A0A2S6BXY1_9PEZI|nr:hypothetical protein CBER1_10228 [Cercospora berteroae]